MRLLFVGGLIDRKGPDILLAAFLDAFQGRDDVTLVVKDFGADSIYPMSDRTRLREYAESGQHPRIVYLHRDMTADEVASLYRACDVLVHPYRGEGFGMPVLEAMACGLPVIVTAGGPTDEFCPDDACWRVRAERQRIPRGSRRQVGHRRPAVDARARHRAPARTAGRGGRRRRRPRGARPCRARGRRGAARGMPSPSGTASGSPRSQPARHDTPRRSPSRSRSRTRASGCWRRPPGGATTAWATCWPPGSEGSRPGNGACLFLLADPRTAPGEDACTERVLAAAAAAGVSLDRAADIVILTHALAGGDAARLHAAVDGYVPLHAACSGHERLARPAGRPVLPPDASALAAWSAQSGRLAA